VSAEFKRRDMPKVSVAAQGTAAVNGVTAKPGSALDEIGALDVIAQEDLVKQRQVTPRELVEAAIRRIDVVNPQLNAVVEKRYEQALLRASSRELLSKPLCSVPVLVKVLPSRVNRITLVASFSPSSTSDR
jgi:hypothetical protein